jgi:ABC-type multidrug transport system fused ATPase/permease subunit
VRTLPLADPGTADHRSAGRLLWWLARGQWRTLVLGMLFGIAWMSAQAVLPAVIGLAIDRGVSARDGGELLRYGGLMFAIGLFQAAAGVMRHRLAVVNWLTAAYRTVQLVGRQAVDLGGALPRKVSTGEVVAIGTTDLSHLGNVMDITARFAGAIVSFVLVAVILLQTSVTLGLVVLVGVPALILLLGPLLGPLQHRTLRQRHLMGELSNTASDIVTGLRVLRGIGGEQVFHERYRRESQHTRRAGVGCSRCSTRSRSSCRARSSCWSCGSVPGTPSPAGSVPVSWSRSTATPRS